MALPTPERCEIQAIATSVLEAIVEYISSASTERTVAETAGRMLSERGLLGTWYYDCPALVLAGKRTCNSISGRGYVPNDEPIGDFNLVTIDLSPCRGDLWGDCARSIYVEGGIARLVPYASEFVEGHRLQEQLHTAMRQFASPDTTFSQLYQFTNGQIEMAGFENLDFLGNVGHSIATRLEDRSYVDADNRRRLGDVSLFTFEPHIRARGGRWGFKHENIYYFGEHGQVAEL